MKPILIIAALFFAFTIIGTLTHELGHYFAGKSLGLSCSIHYHCCHCVSETELEKRRYGSELHSKYGTRDSIPEELWSKYQSLSKSSSESNHLWVTIGGPLQTIITGSIGFILLTLRRRNKNKKLDKVDWLLVFLSLFWLREPFNLLLSLSKGLFLNAESYFGGDELKISRGLDLWDGSIPITLGLIGLLIGLVVTFKYIPTSQRLNFISGGIIGAISGYLIWINFLGPMHLP